jgi:hypothetical protein
MIHTIQTVPGSMPEDVALVVTAEMTKLREAIQEHHAVGYGKAYVRAEVI